jgi:hypothetical protein
MTGPTDPVFVDRSGRRRRLVAVAGSAGALVLVLAVVALLAGVTGTGPAALPGWADTAAKPARTQQARATPTRTTPSASPRTTRRTPDAPATTRSRTAAPTIPSASPTPSARTGSTARNNRRVPTHTPTARPPKKH